MMDQSKTESAPAATPFTLPAETAMGAVHLIVRDRDAMQRFYTDVLGFRVVPGTDPVALSANGTTPLFVFKGDPSASRPPMRSTGLYHTAVRVPSRAALARWLIHVAHQGAHLQGASDHGVSEALYLVDPEGNGLEFYCDRSRSEWPRHGDQVDLVTEALDLEDLLATAGVVAPQWTGLAPETAIGHVHLRVADLEAATVFYHGLLGFDVVSKILGQAHFVSAGGYHHHLGYNIWTSRGASPPPSGSAGLDYFTILLPDQATLDTLATRLQEAGLKSEVTASGLFTADPSGNRLLITNKNA